MIRASVLEVITSSAAPLPKARRVSLVNCSDSFADAMWTLAIALIAFSPPTTRLAPAIQPRAYAPNMGFLDGFKQAFDNEPKLANARQQENKQTSSYVREKMKKREAYEKSVKKAEAKQGGEVQTGNAVLDELFSGWTWK